MTRLNSALGNDTIAPVVLSRLAVLIAWPCAGAVDQDTLLADRGARSSEPGVHLLFACHVHRAEDAAQFRGQRLARGFVHVEATLTP